MTRIAAGILCAFCLLLGQALAAEDSSGTASAGDPLAALKGIPLDPQGSVRLSLGGQMRLRAEDSRGADFGFSRPSKNTGLLWRAYLSADLAVGPYLRIYTELGSGLAPMWNGTAPGTQEDQFDLRQAYAMLTLPLATGRLQVTAGRQEMSYGASRLVSVRDSPNFRRTFDGVRAAWIATPDLRVDAFVTRPVLAQTGIFNDHGDPGQAFWGVYGTMLVEPADDLRIDLYYFGLDRENARLAQGIATQHARTVGVRLSGKHAHFDWDVEGAFQFGSFGSNGIRAWMAATDIGYTIADLPLAPRLGLKADAASGDGNLHDRTIGTFYPLFPRLPTFSEANIAVPSNLLSVQPNLSMTLAPGVQATIGWNPLWKAASADAFYSSALTPVAATAGGAGRYLGHQIVTAVEWQPTSHVDVGATFVHFQPGTRLSQAGGREGSFAAGWVTLKF